MSKTINPWLLRVQAAMLGALLIVFDLGSDSQAANPGITAASTKGQSDQGVQELLHRLEQLEKAQADEGKRSESVRQAHQLEVQKLQERIQQLENKLSLFQTNQIAGSLEASSTAVTHSVDGSGGGDVPRISVGANGFVLSSADTNFVLKLRGLLQIDSHAFFGDSPYLEGNDGFIVRRARPIFEGTVFRDFDFQLTPDFAGNSATLVDAWLNYRYRPELQLRIGKMKGPVGLENWQSDTVGSFNERSMATALVPVRSIGLQLWGDIGSGTAGYSLGVYNPAGDARNPANTDFNDNKEFAGRIFLQPFKRLERAAFRGLGFGVGGSYADLSYSVNGLPNTTGGTLPGYITSELQQFFAYNPASGTVQADGTHWPLSPAGYYYYGPFGLLGEYVISDQAVFNTASSQRGSLHHTAWQASLQWVLTGEPASFTGITPRHPFDPLNGHWGAWQLVGRVSQLNVDEAAFPVFADPTTSAHEALSWAVGVNWWLNRNIRVLTSFSYTTFEGGGSVDPANPGTLVPPATVNAQDEKAFFTRVQLAF